MNLFTITKINQAAKYLLKLPRIYKRIIVLVLDLLICIISVWLSYYLRIGEFQSLDDSISFPTVVVYVISVAIALPIFIVSGLYRAIFRYAGMPAMMTLVRALLMYTIAFTALFTFYGLSGVPRTVGIIQPLVLFILIGGNRACARIWLGGLYQLEIKKALLPRALVYGAGRAGRQIANAMANSREMSIIGYLDDDIHLHGQVLNGLLIYNPSDLAEIKEQENITDILLALPASARHKRKNILTELAKLKLAVCTLPDLNDIATGKISVNHIQELDIDDLLGRDIVKTNNLLLRNTLYNKTVLVTGAGGSIGSELCRQIIKYKPRKILMVDISEHALYQIHKELNIASNNELSIQHADKIIEFVPLLASVCDEVRMNEIMQAWKPNTIYHAAAYKHVPLVEQNAAQGIINNVFGTKICAEVALRHSVQNFVLISTDKAVRPTNIMGATKRIAELVLQGLADNKTSDYIDNKFLQSGYKNITCFSMVRFGNVLGSSGSVVPLFREQIKSGGPITLTHQEITRYFMTVSEAAELVIQAGGMSEGGEVYVLDMGKPVKIYDLACRVIELSGLSLKNTTNLNGDIEIIITGLRPGEKLYEELLIGNNPIKTNHPRILKAHEESLPWGELQNQLNSLKLALGVNDIYIIRKFLQKIINNYKPTGEVVDWVHLEQKKNL